MKNTVIVLVLLAILGVGGYFFLSSKGMAPKVPGAKIANDAQSGGNVFTSIKDALSKSVSLKCVFKDEKGVETTTYIKNGAVRVMMSSSADNKDPNNYVMKDKKMYMWSETTKEGIVISLEEPKNVTPFPTVANQGSTAPEGSSGSGQQESILAEIEKYKDACKPEVVADSMFTVPTDVKFQDMNALQEQMMKGLPKQQVPPQGATGGNAEDYQQYIQQMMQQQGTGR